MADILTQQIEKEEWSDLRKSFYKNDQFNNLVNVQYSELLPVSLI